MTTAKKQSLLCCPNCKGDLKTSKTHLFCAVCQEKYPIRDGIVYMLPEISDDNTLLSLDKWDKKYATKYASKAYLKGLAEYKSVSSRDLLDQIQEYKTLENQVYLELGCGPFYFGHSVADKCKLIVGIDFSINALKIAKELFEKEGIKNYLLIYGDVLNLPIKSNTVDFIYGGGVMEHFEDSTSYLEGIHRVLKKGGVSFNTVPYLNLGTLTYRQLWGNIPNFPVLKPLFEFIHIKLLRGVHLRFGYELSFLASTLRDLHRKAKFSKVKVSYFKVVLKFEIFPPFLRKYFIWFAQRSRLFWPMVKAVATK